MHGAAFGALLTIAITLGFAPMAAAQQALDRTVLPIAHPKPPLYTELDVRNATPPPRFQVKAPEDAPNVVIVLVDDLGFAGTSAYGGPVKTPTFDRMAAAGVRYNNFHTTAVSSPTRAAIKSGRNHH
jgi:arylsulfatase